MSPDNPAETTPPTLQLLEHQKTEEQRSRKLLRRCLAAAVVLHGALFFVPLGQGEAAAHDAPERLIHVYQTERFRPPPAPPEPTPPERRRREAHIVVPGPPVDLEERDTEISEWVPGPVDIPVDLPVAPPAPQAPEPIPVAGDVVPPVKKSGPEPVYPELARRVRRGGMVILSAVIDTEGRLQELSILKDPGFGLGEAALEAARQWTFEPARLNGRPVAVIYTLTVHFEVR